MSFSNCERVADHLYYPRLAMAQTSVPSCRQSVGAEHVKFARDTKILNRTVSQPPICTMAGADRLESSDFPVPALLLSSVWVLRTSAFFSVKPLIRHAEAASQLFPFGPLGLSTPIRIIMRHRIAARRRRCPLEGWMHQVHFHMKPFKIQSCRSCIPKCDQVVLRGKPVPLQLPWS